jgi:integrase
MPKQRTGGIKELENGTFQVRVSYIGSDGKRHERLKKNIDTKTQARRVLRDFLDGLDERGDKAVEGDKLVFRRLARLFELHHVFEAQYVGDRKVAGLRSVAPVRTCLKVLSDHFGNSLVKEINTGDIQKFKLKRLNTPTVRNGQRSIAAVNRELAVMRRLFNFAIENRWVNETPFSRSQLISSADESCRDRILSFTEETRLLTACSEARSHLRPLILTALDTGCRFGELIKLRWRDIDMYSEIISILAFNTKTAESRLVAMTPRVKEELIKLVETSSGKSDALVFGIDKGIRRSWNTACRIAGLENLRFHDLRHTAITRFVATGLPSAEIMRISGHRQANTFLRYVNPKSDALKRAAFLLSQHNTQQSETIHVSSAAIN